MAEDAFVACAIEASSIGIVEQRLAGTRIEVAVFTNFTQDHLDFHGDMQAYWEAKRQLFDWPGLKAAVINVDDPHGARLVGALAGKGPALWTVSAQAEARLQALALTYTTQGLQFVLAENEARVPVRTGLIGDYNVNNLLGVIGALRALGVPLEQAAEAAARVTPVPGRMQRVPSQPFAPEIVVDYAHTPDALEKAISALRPLAKSRGGALWCIFGCGGDRDPGKRPLMAAIAARLADRVVVTSDNPRGEAPAAIINQVVAGFLVAVDGERLAAEPDRRLAIMRGVALAAPADVILIAGKGHEDYQEIEGVRLAFSDVQVAEAALAARGRA
jgi:UDP-N-acetylmuramoyl-L-alanyl-D-glutamate--2,6-diaminopimelate ligase